MNPSFDDMEYTWEDYMGLHDHVENSDELHQRAIGLGYEWMPPQPPKDPEVLWETVEGDRNMDQEDLQRVRNGIFIVDGQQVSGQEKTDRMLFTLASWHARTRVNIKSLTLPQAQIMLRNLVACYKVFSIMLLHDNSLQGSIIFYEKPPANTKGGLRDFFIIPKNPRKTFALDDGWSSITAGMVNNRVLMAIGALKKHEIALLQNRQNPGLVMENAKFAYFGSSKWNFENITKAMKHATKSFVVFDGHRKNHPKYPVAPENRRCVECGSYAEFVCPGCKAVDYCGPQCQKTHWYQGRHKKVCRDAKKSLVCHKNIQQSLDKANRTMEQGIGLPKSTFFFCCD